MEKEALMRKINDIVSDELHVGIELYLCIKEDSGHALRRIQLERKTAKEFQHAFLELLRDKCNEETIEIKPLEDMADNQRVLYSLTQTDEYRPFAFLGENSILEYDSDQQAAIIGYVIKIGNTNNYIHLFQQRNNTLSLRNGKMFFIRKINNVFARVDEELMRIEKKIDVIIIGDEILSDKMKVMERYFGLESVIRKVATETIKKISAMNIIRSNSLLENYERKLSHSRKLMKLKDSPVWGMSKEQIIEGIGRIERYKNVIKVDNGEIVIETVTDVENVIKLLGDAILKSELTDEEYETTVKVKLDKLESSGNNN